jgi:hypothetical protein
MKVYYRVLNVDEENGSISFRYFTDINSEIDLSSLFDVDGEVIYSENGYPLKCRTDVNVSLYENRNPTEEDVKKLAEQSAPLVWLALMDDIKIDPTTFNFNAASQMLGSIYEFNSNTSSMQANTSIELFPEPLVNLIHSIVSNTINDMR